MALILEQQVQRWVCPACDATDVSVGQANRFHECPKMNGLTSPMVPEGVVAKVEAHEREDYIGTELPQLDSEGRPVMNITVTRDEGQDLIVFAPMADTARTDVLVPDPTPDDDFAEIRQRQIADAIDAVERSIRKLEKERSHTAEAEDSLQRARDALAELERL